MGPHLPSFFRRRPAFGLPLQKPDLYLYGVVIRLQSVGHSFFALQSTTSCSLCLATCTEFRRWLRSQLFVLAAQQTAKRAVQCAVLFDSCSAPRGEASALQPAFVSLGCLTHFSSYALASRGPIDRHWGELK